MSTRSWREERQNTNSNSQESDNRHQDKHDEDSAVHQMVVPLGLAIFQLVPWLFVIIHREILDWMFLRYVEPFRMQTQKLTAPRRGPLPQQDSMCGSRILSEVSQPFSRSALAVIMLP